MSVLGQEDPDSAHQKQVIPSVHPQMGWSVAALTFLDCFLRPEVRVDMLGHGRDCCTDPIPSAALATLSQ